MREAGKSYFEGALSVSLSSFVSAASGFATLYFLTQIFTADTLGAYAFSFSIVSLISLIVLLGFERALMLRIARFDASPQNMRGRGMVFRVLLWVGGFSVVMTAGLALVTPWLIAIGAPTESRLILPILALCLLPISASAILQAWLRANHRVSFAQSLYGVVDLVRALLCGLVFLSGGGVIGVMVAVFLSTCVPLVIIGPYYLRATPRPPHFLRPHDLTVGPLILIQKISNFGLRMLDVILLGLLATSAETATYAIAVRLAMICAIGHDAMLPTFSPRGRRYLAVGDMLGIRREYDRARAAALFVALLAAIGFAVFGKSLLSVFGDYEAAFAPLMVLVAGQIIVAGSGVHYSLLAMQGEVVVSSITRLLALVAFIISAIYWIPIHGEIGAAFAVGLALTIVVVLSILLLWQRLGFWAMPGLSVVPVLTSAALAVFCGLGTVSPMVTALGFAAMIGLILISDRESRAMIGVLARQLTNRSA